MENKGNTLTGFQKFCYGFGNLGNCFIYIVVSSYILLYCTNVLGVAAGMIGTIMMIARIFDGFTDVFMGRLIDVTRSRLGKARFWYVISIPPLGICMYLIFNVPSAMSDNGKYIWIFLVYLLISAVFYTMNTVSYNTLVALTTKSQKDQVTMSSISMLFGMAGGVVVASITPSLVEAFGGGQTGWHTIAILYAVIGCLILLVPFFTLRELPEETAEKGNAAHVEEKVSFGQTLKDLAGNKYFIIILLLYLFGYMNTGINTTIGVYYAQYILKNANLLGILSLPSTIAMLIGIIFVPKIIAKMGMKRANVIGAFISAAGFAIATVGNFAGLAVILTGMFIKGLGQAPGAATYSPLMSKTADYNYLKTGHRITGSIFSCASVGTKIGTGLGSALCGWMLQASAFDGMAQEQTAAANHTIFLLFLVIPTVITLATAFLYMGMDVEDKIVELENK